MVPKALAGDSTIRTSYPADEPTDWLSKSWQCLRHLAIRANISSHLYDVTKQILTGVIPMFVKIFKVVNFGGTKESKVFRFGVIKRHRKR